MTAILRDSTVVVVVVVVVVVAAVVRTRPRAIPLVMITMRKSIHGFPLVFYMGMGSARRAAGAPLWSYDVLINSSQTFLKLKSRNKNLANRPIKVAQNSFQLFPRRRFWCVIITSLYQSMLQSWYQKTANHCWTRWYYFRDIIGYHSNTLTR